MADAAARGSILVAGGAGYVGSHACRALAAAGYLPVTFDNLSTGHADAVRWGPLEIGDIADRAALDDAFARHRPVAVMHFAAFTTVGESVTEPARYYRNNVAATLTLLEAMHANGVRELVFSSTCAVYGQPDRLPIVEDMPTRPANPYGSTKLAVEMMLRDFAAPYGLRAAALRYFNAAGAAPEDGLGERHEPETHLIPLVIEAALGRRAEIAVYGTDYPTPDGTCLRDYVHVVDLADAHVRALDLLRAQAGFHAINLGTGTPHSVREIIAAVERVGGRKVPVRLADRRPGDPAALYADAARARTLLGWQPAFGTLDDIIGSAWAWHEAVARTAPRLAASG